MFRLLLLSDLLGNLLVDWGGGGSTLDLILGISIREHVGLGNIGELIQLWNDESGQVSEFLDKVTSETNSVIPSSLWNAVISL